MTQFKSVREKMEGECGVRGHGTIISFRNEQILKFISVDNGSRGVIDYSTAPRNEA